MRKLLLFFLGTLLASAGAYSQCSLASTTFTGPTTCGGNNGTITLVGLTDAASSYSITYKKDWSGPITATFTTNGTSAIISGLTAGVYTDIQIVHSSGNCSAAGPFVLWDPNPQPLVITPASSTICSGQSVTLTASGGSGFTWTSNILNTKTGSVVTATPFATETELAVVGKDVNNCMSEGRASIRINYPRATVSGSTAVCLNGTSSNITFAATGGTAPFTFTYTLNGGANESVTSTGNTATVAVPTHVSGTMAYSLVSVTDALSCPGAASGTATVTINGSATVDALTSQTVCNGSALSIPFSSSLTGTLVNWTNTNSSIGIGAAGMGDIPAFTAVNTGTAPVTSTITVMPKVVTNGFAYVPNYRDNTVSAINTYDNSVVATIPVGVSPSGVAISSDGSKVYVANKASNTLSVINTGSNTVVATITVGRYPTGVAVSPDGNRVYVSNQDDNSVSVIDAATNTAITTVPVGMWPNGIVVSNDGNKVYVVNRPTSTSTAVSVISTATNTISKIINVGPAPEGIVQSPDGTRLYVANYGNSTISVINTITESVIATVSVLNNIFGNSPRGVALSPDGSKLYVTNAYSNNVSVVATATNTVIATVPVGYSPGGVSVTPDGTKVYVVNGASETVSVINTATNTVAATVERRTAVNAFGNFIAPGSVCTGAPQTFTITVNPTATVNTIANATYCHGDNQSAIHFASPTTGGTLSYSWASSADVGFGTAGTGDIAAYTATNTSASPITATVTVTPSFTNDGVTCAGTPMTFTITVNPKVTVAAIANQTHCNNTTTTAVSLSSPVTGVVMNWTNSNTTIGLAASGTGDIPSFRAVNNSGTPVIATITVTPTYANGGVTCTGTPVSFTITVNPTPTTPTISTSTSPTFCQGGSVVLTSSSANGNQWYEGATLLVGETNSTYTATTSGNYTVKVTQNSCVSVASTPVTVTVNSIPAVPTITPGSSTTICEGNSVTLTSSASAGNQWNKDGVAINGATAATYSATTGGRYSVTATQNACSSGPSAAITIVVTSLPATPAITAASPVTFCAGGSVSLASSAGTGNQWYKDGASINGATAQTYSATSSGNYTVRVTQNGCTSATPANTVVTVTPLPATPVITALGNVLTSSAASGNQWFLNEVLIPGATAANYNVEAAGPYKVKVTQNGCTAMSAVHNFTTTAIVPPTAWNGEVLAYPNPVTRTLYIKNPEKRKLEVRVVDALGQVIYHTRLTTTTGNIDLSVVAAGPYQLLLTDIVKQETISFTIIKQ